MRRVFAVVFCMLLCIPGCAGKETPSASPGGVDVPGGQSEAAEALFVELTATLNRTSPCMRPWEKLLEPAKPGDVNASALRGMACCDLDKHEEAFEELTRAVRLEPSAVHYALRGMISLRGGELVAARRDLDYALKKDSKEHRAWNISGMLALREGDVAGACKAFTFACSNGNCEFLQTARNNGHCK